MVQSPQSSSLLLFLTLRLPSIEEMGALRGARQLPRTPTTTSPSSGPSFRRPARVRARRRPMNALGGTRTHRRDRRRVSLAIDASEGSRRQVCEWWRGRPPLRGHARAGDDRGETPDASGPPRTPSQSFDAVSRRILSVVASHDVGANALVLNPTRARDRETARRDENRNIFISRARPSRVGPTRTGGKLKATRENGL